MECTTGVVIIGTGATALTDLWALVRKPVFGMPAPDYGAVGRWMGLMPRGQFRHDKIAAAPAVRGERLIGWTAHYVIGIAYAAVLVALTGCGWLRSPTPGPALAVGIATVAAPFLLMQPGMGAGVAASRTPRPWTARLHSVLMHAVFGAGLYLSAALLARVGA